MRRKYTKKVLQNGRNATKDQYLKLSYKMLSSANFRSLSGPAVKILFEIAIRHNGFNNGKIVVSHTELQNALRLGRQTINRSLLELQASQFIVLHKKGVFIGRRASEWEVTFLPVDGMPASNIWGQAPILKKGRRRQQKCELNILQDAALEINRQRVKNYIQKNE